MVTKSCGFLLANSLIAKCKNNALVSEKELMDDIWENMNSTVEKNGMIDIPLRRDSNDRIPDVVDVLRDWIGRGIVEIHDKKVAIYFSVANILRENFPLAI